MNKFLLFMALSCALDQGIRAQSSTLNSSVSLSLTDVPLSAVLENMTAEYGVKFSYNNNRIPLEENVTISVKEVSLKSVLNKLFENLPVSYVATSGGIILKYNDLKQTVRGRIIDSETLMPVIGASVVISGTDPLQGTTTGVNGYFRIENVLLGRKTIQVKHLSYEPATVPNVLIGSGKETVLNLELVESIQKLQEIVVKAETADARPVNELATISARSFTAEETRRFAVSVGDPARLASAYAGVTVGDDGTNEIIVRGNTPRGILWKLEGMEIPSPSHFSSEGASSGGISMLSTNVMGRSDFFTGAFPAEYGNATSGVFDIKLRNGNEEKAENTIQVGLLGLDLASEGPFKKGRKSSFLVNYRYSTLAILDEIGVNLQDEGQKNTFQDLSLKFNFPTKKLGTFSVFGLGGLSKFQENIPNSFKELQTYDLGVIGANHLLPLGKTAYVKTTLGVSATSVEDKATFLISPDTTFVNSSDFTKSYINLSSAVGKKFSARIFAEAGVIYRKISFDFFNNIKNPFNDPEFQDFNLFNQDGSSYTMQGYLTSKYRISEQLSLIGGAHIFHFGFNGETSFEPRGGFQYKIGNNKVISGGFGLHSRLESLEFYLANSFAEDGTMVRRNTNLKSTKARHYALGYEHFISANLRFKAEVYYQDLYDVPVLRRPGDDPYSTLLFSDGFANEALINAGTGENYGIELSLEKSFSKGYFFLMNTSIYEAKYTNKEGITRNSRYNGNFGTNFLAGKEIRVGKNGKNNILGFNVKSTFSGNRRFVPIDLPASRAEGEQVLLLNEAFEKRYPNYFRMDLQLSFRKNKPKVTTEWRLDVQNVFDRKNILEQFYLGSTGNLGSEFQLGLIPVLSYRIEF